MAVSQNLRLLSDFVIKNIPNEIDRKTLSDGMSLALRQEVKLGEYHRNRQPMNASKSLYESIRVRFSKRKTISKNLLFDVIMNKYGFYQSDGYQFNMSWQKLSHKSIILDWMKNKGMLKSGTKELTQAAQFISYIYYKYGRTPFIPNTNWIENSMQKGIENNFNINISDKFRQEFSNRLTRAIIDGK